MGALLLILLCFGQEAPRGGLLESLEKDLVRVVERVRPCVATVDIDRSFPLPPVSLSGFLLDRLDREGTIVTAGAALEGAHRVSVRFAEGPSLRGEFVGRGPGNRVGLIRVRSENLPDPPLSVPAPLRPGSIVVGIGSPYGFQGSAFLGCVSGSDRTLGGVSGLLQTTVPVNRGNAGGALANVRGEIVGMLVGPYEESRVLTLRLPSVGPEMEKVARRRSEGEELDPEEAEGKSRVERFSATVPSEGIHFALPIASVREEARSILEGSGRASAAGENRRWLGIYLDPSIDPALRAHLDLEEGEGLLVREVYRGSPAARAGLEPNDMLLSLDGARLDSTAEGLRRRLDAKPAGARVEFELMRRGARQRLAVVLE